MCKFAPLIAYLYVMTKKYRHKIIREVLQTNDINSQDMLLKLLVDKGFELTQATLSREFNINKSERRQRHFLFQILHRLRKLIYIITFCRGHLHYFQFFPTFRRNV